MQAVPYHLPTEGVVATEAAQCFSREEYITYLHLHLDFHVLG